MPFFAFVAFVVLVVSVVAVVAFLLGFSAGKASIREAAREQYRAELRRGVYSPR